MSVSGKLCRGEGEPGECALRAESAALTLSASHKSYFLHQLCHLSNGDLELLTVHDRLGRHRPFSAR